MNIYEQHGRLIEKLATEEEAHRQTCRVLCDLKDGRLRLDQLDVDESSLTWATNPGRLPPGPDRDPTAPVAVHAALPEATLPNDRPEGETVEA